MCKKKEKKSQKQTIKEKQENQRKKKMRQNEKSEKCIKEIFQGNYKKKRFIQSFKPREEILKLKIKITNIK